MTRYGLKVSSPSNMLSGTDGLRRTRVEGRFKRRLPRWLHNTLVVTGIVLALAFILPAITLACLAVFGYIVAPQMALLIAVAVGYGALATGVSLWRKKFD